jgi:uncharacterized protein
MTMVAISLLALFVILGLGMVFSTIIGLPGGWGILLAAILLEVVDVSLGVGPVSFGWWIIATSGVIQVASEVIEFAASALGAKWGGASKRGMWASLVGGIVGAIGGIFIIPIPIFGSLIGSVIGSFVAAFAAERKELENNQAIKSATGAALGRTVGALSKVGFSFAMLVILSLSMTYNYFF